MKGGLSWVWACWLYVDVGAGAIGIAKSGLRAWECLGEGTELGTELQQVGFLTTEFPVCYIWVI